MSDKQWIFFRGQTSENKKIEFKLLATTCCRDKRPVRGEVRPKAIKKLAEGIKNGDFKPYTYLNEGEIIWALSIEELDSRPTKLGQRRSQRSNTILSDATLMERSYKSHFPKEDEQSWWRQ